MVWTRVAIAGGSAAALGALVWLNAHFGPDPWPAVILALAAIGGLSTMRWAIERERAYLRAIEALQRRDAANQDLHRQRDEFIALIAHELRKPVAAIEMAAASLGGTSLPFADRRDRRALAGLQSEARRLERLAEDILAIGRLETTGLDLNLVRCDLARTVREVADASTEPSRIVVQDAIEACAIADPERVAQVLDNLVGNALKYSSHDSKIEVRTMRMEDRAVVEVTDHGIGIAQEQLPRLFKKYERLAGSGAAGIGLGLYLVRLLVEAMGGSVTARSAGPGHGSTFVVEMPVAS